MHPRCLHPLKRPCRGSPTSQHGCQCSPHSQCRCCGSHRCSQPRVSHDDASDRHTRESSEHKFRPCVSGSAWTLKDGVSTTRVVYRWLERHVDFDDKTCAMTVEGRMHVTARPHSGPRKQFAHTTRSHEMIGLLFVNDYLVLTLGRHHQVQDENASKLLEYLHRVQGALNVNAQGQCILPVVIRSEPYSTPCQVLLLIWLMR